jgi:dTDP-4-amino-4,6-dideoxygalactose transaminase
LEKIDGFNARRRELVAKIKKELQDVPEVRLAHVYPDTQPNYWLYPVWGPPSMGRQGEINYVEVEYQRMQKLRRTSVGVPLPDYVQYVPGSCPKAEESTLGASGLFVHHSVEDEELDRTIADFKERVSAARS